MYLCWSQILIILKYNYSLGDNESGKTTLIAKLQGVEDPKKGSGLEYAYIDVRDEYRDGKFFLKIFIYKITHTSMLLISFTIHWSYGF